MSIPTLRRDQPAGSQSVATWQPVPPTIADRPAVRQTSLAVMDQVLVSGTNFATAVLIGRICGTEQFGIYALAFTVLTLLATVQESFILTPYTVYCCRMSGKRKAEFAGSVLTQFLIFALLVIGCVFLAGIAMGYFVSLQARLTTWILCAILPFTLLREFGRRFSFAHLHIVQAALADLGVTVIQLTALAMLAILGTLSANSALMVVGMATALSGGCWLWLHRRSFVINRARIIPDFQNNFHLGRWSLAARITSVVHGNSVAWILALLRGVGAVGGFAACMTLISACNPFLMGIGSVLGPQTARAYARGGMSRLRTVVGQATLLVIAVTGVFSAVLVFVGPQILVAVFGSEFASFGPVVVLLAAVLLANVVGMGADNGLRAIERPDLNFLASLTGLCVTAVSALVLIPEWGISGGAIGLLLGTTIITLIRCVAFVARSRGEA